MISRTLGCWGVAAVADGETDWEAKSKRQVDQIRREITGASRITRRSGTLGHRWLERGPIVACDGMVLLTLLGRETTLHPSSSLPF